MGENDPSSDKDDRATKEIECDNGHTHAVSDLDKVGMEYRCPECFTAVEVHNA